MIGFAKRLKSMQDVNGVILDTDIGLCTTSQILELSTSIGLMKLGYNDPIISVGSVKNIENIEKSIFISKESVITKEKCELFHEILTDLSSKNKISTKDIDIIQRMFVPNIYKSYRSVILKNFYDSSIKMSPSSVWSNIYKSISISKNIILSLCQDNTVPEKQSGEIMLLYNDIYQIEHPIDRYPDDVKYIAYGEWDEKIPEKRIIIHRTYDRDGIPKILIPPEFFVNTKYINGIISVDTVRQDFIVVEEKYFSEVKRYLEIRCGVNI